MTKEELEILQLARFTCVPCHTPDAYGDEGCMTCYAYEDAKKLYDAGYKLQKTGSWTRYSSTMMICSSCGKHVPYHKYEYCLHCGSKNRRQEE